MSEVGWQIVSDLRSSYNEGSIAEVGPHPTDEKCTESVCNYLQAHLLPIQGPYFIAFMPRLLLFSAPVHFMTKNAIQRK